MRTHNQNSKEKFGVYRIGTSPDWSWIDFLFDGLCLHVCKCLRVSQVLIPPRELVSWRLEMLIWNRVEGQLMFGYFCFG